MITRLVGFRVNAELMGEIHSVSYDGDSAGGTLSISGLDLSGAYSVLEKLATGSTVSMRLPTEPQRVSPPDASASPAPAVPAAPPPQPAPEEAPEPAAAKATLPTSAPPHDVVGKVASNGDGKLPESVRQANKLKDVVVWLMDRGISGAEAIAAECEKMRPEVPMLGRITNLPERVARALVTIEGKAS
jgi:hypothetical protein